MIFLTYLHVRDAFIRASQQRLKNSGYPLPYEIQYIDRFKADERLEIIKEIVHEQNVVEHDDFLQILIFAIEYHEENYANNWDVIKYLIEEKKVRPGKVTIEKYGDEVYQNFLIEFIFRGNQHFILDYLLKHDKTNSLLEQFMKYYIGDGTADAQMKILPLENRQTFGVIRMFAEHFGKQFRWYHNTKMMLSFLNQLGTKYEYQHLRTVEKNMLIEIMNILQGYLEKALNVRKQIGSELPIPDELASLVFEFF